MPTSRPGRPSHLGKSAIVSAGSAPYVKQPGETILAVAAGSCAAALRDAGLSVIVLMNNNNWASVAPGHDQFYPDMDALGQPGRAGI